GLATEADTDDAGEDQLSAHLQETLARAGLADGEVILSPAQRRAAGLVTPGATVRSVGRFVAWVAAAAIVAAVVAIALRPEPAPVPVAAVATTLATTTTIPPIGERIV